MTKKNKDISKDKPTDVQPTTNINNVKEDAEILRKTDLIISHLEQHDMFKKVVSGIISTINARHTEQDVQEKVVKERVEVPIEKIVEKRVEVPVEKIVEVEKPVTPDWAKPTQTYHELASSLSKIPKLANILIPAKDADPLLQFIVCASQWKNLLRIWDELASSCKSSEQPISADEAAILNACISLYNLNQAKNPATLADTAVGSDYDFELQQKVAGSGDKVKTILLQGLKNPAGELKRSCLVTC